VAITLKNGQSIRFTPDDPIHDIPEEDAKRLMIYVNDKSPWLEIIDGPTTDPEPEPVPEPEPEPEDVEPDDGDVLADILDEEKPKVVEFDIDKWDGIELPDHLNSKSELMRQNKKFLEKMCLLLGLNEKGPKDHLATRILHEFEEGDTGE